MDRNERIAASVRRAAKLKVEATRRDAQTAMYDAARRGILHSSMHVENVERTCVAGYREICQAAAVVIAEIEGADAPQHAARLDEILREAQADLLEIFHQHASPGRSGGHMKQFVDTRRPYLREVLDQSLQGTVADLELGIAGGVNVMKQKSGVSIDNRGGSAQVIVDSPNASQTVGRDQMSSGSIDPAAIMELLREVRDEVAKVEVAPDARDEIQDAIVNAEREVASPTPDSSRTLRLLWALSTRLEQFGIGVAASLLAAYLQAKRL
jgi:hypothetical protein